MGRGWRRMRGGTDLSRKRACTQSVHFGQWVIERRHRPPCVGYLMACIRAIDGKDLPGSDPCGAQGPGGE
jgi:hypothetical protein